MTPREQRLFEFWKSLGLSTRTACRLSTKGFEPVAQTIEAGEQQLRRIDGLGVRSFAEIKRLWDLPAERGVCNDLVYAAKVILDRDAISDAIETASDDDIIHVPVSALRRLRDALRKATDLGGLDDNA